jgi:hypothetical protein
MSENETYFKFFFMLWVSSKQSWLKACDERKYDAMKSNYERMLEAESILIDNITLPKEVYEISILKKFT